MGRGRYSRSRTSCASRHSGILTFVPGGYGAGEKSGKFCRMGEDVIIAFHRGMTAEAFLRESGILAIGPLVHTCPAGETPATGFRVFPAVLDHEFRMHELTGNNGAIPVFMNGVFPDQFAEYGAVRPRVRVASARCCDGCVIAEDDPQGVVVVALRGGYQAPVTVA